MEQRHTETRVQGALRRAAAITSVALLSLTAGCGRSLGETLNERWSPNITAAEAPTFTDQPVINRLEPPLENPEGNEKINPRGITLHWWSFDAKGDIRALRQELVNNASCDPQDCSVQYAVTMDGKIYRMMRTATEKGWHARGGNDTTFGIEIEGKPESFALSGPNYNPKKFGAVVSLAAKLVKDFGLPIEGDTTCGKVSGIHGHHELNHCPGALGSPDTGDAYTQAVIAEVRKLQPAS